MLVLKFRFSVKTELRTQTGSITRRNSWSQSSVLKQWDDPVGPKYSSLTANTVQNMKFSIKNFFGKCSQKSTVF